MKKSEYNKSKKAFKRLKRADLYHPDRTWEYEYYHFNDYKSIITKDETDTMHKTINSSLHKYCINRESKFNDVFDRGDGRLKKSKGANRRLMNDVKKEYGL